MTTMAGITQITDDTTGRWLVRSETSAYLLDLDRMVGMRLPGEGAGSTTSPDDVMIASLRKDGQEFTIAAVLKCVIGEPMLLFARGISDEPGVDTIRRTTYVRSITPHASASDSTDVT